MEAMVAARQQTNEDTKVARILEAKAEAEARAVALEERMTATEERKLALEEKNVANEEHQRLVEEERKLFCIDTSNMDERQNEYINLARDEVLAKKRMMANYLKSQSDGKNAPMSGYEAWVAMELWRYRSTTVSIWRNGSTTMEVMEAWERRAEAMEAWERCAKTMEAWDRRMEAMVRWLRWVAWDMDG
jgi:hypothetical protein